MQANTTLPEESQTARVVDIIGIIILGVGALLMLAPFLWMFSTSLRSYTESFQLPPQWLPLNPDFTHYIDLFQRDVPFGRFFWNSFFITGVVTVGLLITCSMAGYAFARLRFPGREVLFSVLLISLMIPIQVTIIPLFIIMRQLGLVDSHWSLTLPALTGAFAPGLPGALGIFMMRQFFLTLPVDLNEAAKIDGAGYWTTFWKVILPLAGPSLAALAIITIASAWNDYFLPLVFLSSIEKMVLPVGILALREPLSTGSAVVLAAVTLSILPVFIVFLVGQRWIIESVARTGVKG